MEINFNCNTSLLLNGIGVHVSDLACVTKEWKQFRKPKSKKQRIVNKWKKRSSNFRLMEVHRAIFMKNQNKVIVSQKTYEQLKNHKQIKGVKWT